MAAIDPNVAEAQKILETQNTARQLLVGYNNQVPFSFWGTFTGRDGFAYGITFCYTSSEKGPLATLSCNLKQAGATEEHFKATQEMVKTALSAEPDSQVIDADTFFNVLHLGNAPKRPTEYISNLGSVFSSLEISAVSSGLSVCTLYIGQGLSLEKIIGKN